MTARAQVHEQKAYLDLGAIGVVVKPFDPVTLGDRLLAMWDAARERSANGVPHVRVS